MTLAGEIRSHQKIASWLRFATYFLLALASHIVLTKSAVSIACNIAVTVLIIACIVGMIVFSKKARNKQYILNNHVESTMH